MFKFSCPYFDKGCSKRFRSQSGRTYHVRSAHGTNHNILNNQRENTPDNEIFHDNNQELLVELEGREDDHVMDPVGDDVPPLASAPAQPQPHTPQRNIHPHINGILSLHLFHSWF